MSDTALFAQGLLNPHAPLPALVKGRVERRYAVYRNNVTVGLIRALEANFPAVQRLLGEAYFSGFARDYARTHPPKSPLMFTYGDDFPEALEQASDLANYPYLADIARLEILWRQSYHAVDAAPLSPDALAKIAPELLFDIRFISHPAMHVLKSDYAAHSIFLANRSADVEANTRPDMPQCVLVTRPHHEVSVIEISPAQFNFFTALTANQTLSEALETAANGDESFDVSATLALQLHSGAFRAIQTKTEQIT